MDAELARVRQRHPSWVIVVNADGSYTARRDFFGSQQIMTLASLAELDQRLSAAGGR
jgi:hypothetical protein